MRTTLTAMASTALIIISAIAWANVDIGPTAGTKIPVGFTALDQTGEHRSFSDITGENGVVLAFQRSADWCPFCQQQMINLQTIIDDLAQRGYTLATLSYGPQEVLQKFAKRQDISYIMLSDEKSAMIDAFDLRDPQYKPGTKTYGVPRPAIFIIDPEGIIRGKLAEEGYRVRPSVEAVLKEVDNIARQEANARPGVK